MHKPVIFFSYSNWLQSCNLSRYLVVQQPHLIPPLCWFCACRVRSDDFFKVIRQVAPLSSTCSLRCTLYTNISRHRSSISNINSYSSTKKKSEKPLLHYELITRRTVFFQPNHTVDKHTCFRRARIHAPAHERASWWNRAEQCLVRRVVTLRFILASNRYVLWLTAHASYRLPCPPFCVFIIIARCSLSRLFWM